MYFCLHWILFFALLAWDRLIIACFKIVMVMFDIIFFFVAIASADQFQDSSPARSQSYIWIRDDLQRPGLTESRIRRSGWWVFVSRMIPYTYVRYVGFIPMKHGIVIWMHALIIHMVSYGWYSLDSTLGSTYTYIHTYIHTVAVSRIYGSQDSLL